MASVQTHIQITKKIKFLVLYHSLFIISGKEHIKLTTPQTSKSIKFNKKHERFSYNTKDRTADPKENDRVLYLDADLAIALRPLKLLHTLLHNLLAQQRDRHFFSTSKQSKSI